MARIVLAAPGSGGDVMPLVPIALELQTRGHECTLAAPPAITRALGDTDLRVRALGGVVGRRAARERDLFDHRWRGYRALDRFWRTQLDELDRTIPQLVTALDRADLLVHHPFHAAALAVLPGTPVRQVVAHLHPWFLPTRYAAPPGLRSVRPLERLTWRALRLAWRRRVDPAINAARRATGLMPLREAGLSGGLDGPCLVLSDPSYAPRRPDWALEATHVGYPHWDAPGPSTDTELEAFTESPYLVATLGTALPLDPESFYEHLFGALRLAPTTRAVVLGTETTPEDLCDRVLVRSYHPLSSLVDRAQAIVHHGGAGTTQAALRAGCPSVVVPRCYDQRHHADRVEDLGAGTSIPWRHADRSTLARAIDEVLSNPSYRAGAERHAGIVADMRPAHAAADLIEGALR